MTGTLIISASYPVTLGTNQVLQTITLGETVRTIVTGLTVPISAGFLTLIPPTGAQMVIFIPPSNNTHAITLSGLALHMTQPSLIAMDLVLQNGVALQATGAPIPGCTAIYL